jgi:mRNA-degrading endonuclease RelE of RelBE toxin-antitoxin system
MMMCDVHYEQKAQKALKDRKAEIQKEISSHWGEMEKNQMAEYDEKMQAKLEVEYKNKISNAKAISD